MNWKILLYRLMVFVTLCVGGMFLFAVTANLLMMFDLMPEGFDGATLTRKAVYVAMGSIPIGIVGFFIKETWGRILFLCPLYTPSLFAIAYTIIH